MRKESSVGGGRTLSFVHRDGRLDKAKAFTSVPQCGSLWVTVTGGTYPALSVNESWLWDHGLLGRDTRALVDCLPRMDSSGVGEAIGSRRCPRLSWTSGRATLSFRLHDA